MKHEYKKPEITVREMDESLVLTASAVEKTEKAMRTGTLEVNGNKLDSDASIVSISF